MNKVFGIGLSRTGTKGLATALDILGVKTMHFPDTRDTFKLLSNGFFRLPILEDYDAITDIQTVPFYPQFDEEYPNSKFILTVRDMDAWLESTRTHFGPGKGKGSERENRKRFRALKNLDQNWLRAAVYGTLVWDRSVYRHVYNKHQAAVKDYFKGRDNLLVMNVCAGEGWEKLCPFLGVDIPNRSWPRGAECDRFVKRSKREESRRHPLCK